jgi:hypothetical protein
MRLATGHEALVSRVLADGGRTGFGFNLQLDATAARHMAEFTAGLRAERPHLMPVMAHPWETAWVSNQPIPWDVEPAFFHLQWLP